MKLHSHFSRVTASLIKQELGITIVALLALAGLAGGSFIFWQNNSQVAGDVDQPNMPTTQTKVSATSLIINGREVSGINFSATRDWNYFQATNQWIGANQDVITTDDGTYGTSAKRTYTYKVALDRPFTGNLQAAGNFKNLKINGRVISSSRPTVALLNATSLSIQFAGGPQNIISKLSASTTPVRVAFATPGALQIVPSTAQLAVGQFINLKALLVENGASLSVSAKWSTREESNGIIKIEATGKVTGLSEGKAYVVAEASGTKAVAEINVVSSSEQTETTTKNTDSPQTSRFKSWTQKLIELF